MVYNKENIWKQYKLYVDNFHPEAGNHKYTIRILNKKFK